MAVHVTAHVTEHVTEHVTAHVTAHMAEHVTAHVTGVCVCAAYPGLAKASGPFCSGAVRQNPQQSDLFFRRFAGVVESEGDEECAGGPPKFCMLKSTAAYEL
eukprot:2724584-Rhodomonas_salina.1